MGRPMNSRRTVRVWNCGVGTQTANGDPTWIDEVHAHAAHTSDEATETAWLITAVAFDEAFATGSLCAIVPIVHIQMQKSAVKREARLHNIVLRLSNAVNVMKPETT